MSALKHGLFRAGFMLCDRCAWNAECRHFKPGGHCVLERRAFRKVVSELMEEFELESVADRILVERAGMYLFVLRGLRLMRRLLVLRRNQRCGELISVGWIIRLGVCLMIWL